MTSANVCGWQAVVAAAMLLWPACASPQAEDKSNSPPNVIDGVQLVEALRGGGYVLYFRHGKTDMSTRDSDRTSLANCATQRALSDEGRRQMTDIGKQFQRLRIPVGTVLASPYCRTIDTAKLAFGTVTIESELEHTVTATEALTRQRAAALSKVLATVPRAGTNTVLAGHTGNLQEATGIWPSPEGVAIVFKPDGKGASHYQATVGPDRWAELGRGQEQPTAKSKR